MSVFLDDLPAPSAEGAASAAEKLATMAKEYAAANAPKVETGADTAPPAQPTVDELLAAQQSAAEQRDAKTIESLLTEAGLSPSTTATGAECSEYINGKRSITPELRAELDAKVAGWERDTDFQRRVIAGEPDATRLLRIASAMRCAPVEPKA